MDPLTKLVYVMSLVAVGVTALGTDLERRFVTERGFVRGEERVLAETIGVVFRSRSRPKFYLRFTRATADSVMAGATATLRGPGTLRDVTIEADTGTVHWYRQYRQHPSASGVIVRIHGVVNVPPGAAKNRDTLDVSFPAATRVADARDETPLIARASYAELVPGASADVRYYDVRDRGAADARRQRLIVLELVLVGLLAVIGARFAYRLLQ